MEGEEVDIKKFKVIIAGSRDFDDYQLLKSKVDKILSNKRKTHQIIIISGTARGADRLGERYAKESGFEPPIKMPADWDKYGKKAGHIRNQEMLDIADAVIVFWDGKTPGSKNMISITQKSKKPLRIILF